MEDFGQNIKYYKALELSQLQTNTTTGLNDVQVNERIKHGLVNCYAKNASKTIWQIFAQNAFTLFNLINIILFISLLLVGSYKNMLFMGVVISNLLIGTIQELRAKHAIDRLSILASTKTIVVRNSRRIAIEAEEIVADDIIEYKSGNQINADCVVVSGECEVDESFLTGESVPIIKHKGDTLLSGSFIVSGSCSACAINVGRNAYVNSIIEGAKQLKFSSSEIMRTLKLIIRAISIAIFPIGAALTVRQVIMLNEPLNESIVAVVAALIGMIPEGLMLLTSAVFAVSTLRLSRRGVLARELDCIESLARVNILCLDKTGTLTEGKLEVKSVVLVREGIVPNQVLEMMNTLMHGLKTGNSTYNALFAKFHNPDKRPAPIQKVFEFSSDRKWSGIALKNGKTIIIGAPEFILPEMSPELAAGIGRYAVQNRVILLAETNGSILSSQQGKASLPQNITPTALILLQDTIRSTARETLQYFKSQKVTIKIISGDNIATTSATAERAGVEGFENAIDMSALNTDEETKAAATQYTVFARVSPRQKAVLIEAMKEHGNTVAMIGDGVNDVLALRTADCSIAMSEGSDAAKCVSQFVITRHDFSSLPSIVAEGRRSVNNIQDMSSLFLVKTIYSTLLSVIFVLLPFQYPFHPIQLSLISTLSIGIPSFVLALQPNTSPIRGNFIRNVLRRALPGALSVVSVLVLILLLTQNLGLSDKAQSTLCLLSVGFLSMAVLFNACRPFNKLKLTLFTAMALAFLCSVMFFHDFLSIVPLLSIEMLIVLPFIGIAYMLYKIFQFISNAILKTKT